MKQYKCKKSFCVDKYDDDGFLIENSSVVIKGKSMSLMMATTQLLEERFILILMRMDHGWKLQKNT